MKSFVIYLILVGIPIAGVVGVLQAGRAALRHPPTSVAPGR
jgi:hypothetical protein